MQIIQPQNIASTVITVTNTATALFSLINTAGSVTNSQDYFLNQATNGQGIGNALLITPEDGNVRLGYNVTPTGTTGTLLSSGVKYYIPNVRLADIKLIRTSGDVKCSVDIALAQPGEDFSAVAEAVTLEAASVTIGDIGGTYVDDADWTDSSSKHLLVGGLYQSSPQTVTNGDVAPFNMTTNGALHVSDAGGSFTVDQSTAASLNCTEASASAIKTAVELIDDSVYTDGSGTPSKGVAVMGTDGTNPQIISVDSNGVVKVDIQDTSA